MATATDAVEVSNGARRMIALRVATIAGACMLGLVLNHLVQDHLATLEELAQTDPIAARTRLATEFRIGGLGLFLLTGALGAALIAAARRARRDERFPPAGIWSWGATRTFTGIQARYAAVVGFVLGAMLLGCSIAGAALTWEIGTKLLTCPAGVRSPDGSTRPAGTDI